MIFTFIMRLNAIRNLVVERMRLQNLPMPILTSILLFAACFANGGFEVPGSEGSNLFGEFDV